MINSIKIRRFRSIDDMTVNFGQLTTLVGRNDAGKSNVVRALNLFFNGETDIGQHFNLNRDLNLRSKIPDKSAKEIIIEIIFTVPDSFKEAGKKVRWKKIWRKDGEVKDKEVMKFADGTKLSPRSRVKTSLQKQSVLVVPAIKDVRYFAKILGDIYDQLSQRGGVKFAKSGVEFNSSLDDDVQDLIGGLKSALGEDFTITLPENLRPIFETLNIMNADGIPFDRRGDGIKIRHIPELLYFLTTLKDHNSKGPGSVNINHIWIFEEPENNLEFSAAFDMIERLKVFLDKNKDLTVLMTTHSPVFYGMNTAIGDKNRKRYFVSLDGDNHSQCKQISDEDVHQEMGILPLVADAITPIKEQLDETKRIKEELEKNGINRDRLKIFVEGKCDNLVITKALNVYYPSESKKIDVVNAEIAGVQSAMNCLNAWQLEQQHRVKPVRAVAILDNDLEGHKAKSHHESIKRTHKKHTMILFLLASGQALSNLPAGYKSIIDLESLFSDDIWDFAERNFWLEDRDAVYLQENCLPPNIRKGLALGKVSSDQRFKGLSNPQRIRLEKKFTLTGKIDTSDYIHQMSKKDAKCALANFKPTLNKSIKFLFNNI